MPIYNWLKNNKLTAILFIVVLYLLFSSRVRPIPLLSSVSRGQSMDIMAPATGGFSEAEGMVYDKKLEMPPQPNFSPQADIEDRMVIEQSNMSLLVKDVVQTRDQIVDYAQSNGGYMVSSRLSNPQDNPTGTVVVRVRSDNLKDVLEFFRSLAIKVVSENLEGTDVTDQYVDVDKRIGILEKTKARFEAILDQVQEVSDIMQLNREIINIQSQIDSLKGQQDALEKRANLAKITIYLSTDEIALPYAPSDIWRPNVIFKLAVRSLIGNLRKLGSLLIWLGVYSIIWIPVLMIVWVISKMLKKKQV